MENFKISNPLLDKKIFYQKDEEKAKKIRSILGYDEDILKPKKPESKIKVRYNQTVYFENPQNSKNSNEKQIEKLISNVFNNTSSSHILDKIEKGSNIKFNFNINNNFYNANINNAFESKNDKNTFDENYKSINCMANNPRITYNNPRSKCIISDL